MPEPIHAPIDVGQQPADVARTTERISPVRQAEIQTLGNSLVRRQINRINANAGKTPAERTAYFDQQPPGMRIIQSLNAYVTEGGNWDFTQGGKKPEGDANVGNPLLVTLSAASIESRPDLAGRHATVTHVKRIEGNRVVCTVSVPVEDGKAGVPPMDIVLTRQEMFTAQIAAEADAIVGAFPAEQQEAVRQYITILSGKDTGLTEEQAAKLIESTARHAGFITVADLRSGILRTLKANQIDVTVPPPVDPMDAYQEKLARWQTDQEALPEDQRSEAGKPIPPGQEELSKYQEAHTKWQQNQEALSQVMSNLEAHFQGQTLADPEALTRFLAAQVSEADQTLLQKELDDINADMERIRKELEERRLEKTTGKKIGSPDAKVDKAEVETEIKKLEDELGMNEELLKAIEAAKGEGLEGAVKEYFQEVQAGEVSEEDSQMVSEAMASGDLDFILDLVKKKKLQSFQDASGELSEKHKHQIELLEKQFARMKKIKGVGKAALIGMAMFMVLGLIQGMGGQSQ